MSTVVEITQQDIDKSYDSPSYFSEKFLKFILHWYQVEMLEAVVNGQDVCICCSRQIGKTEIMAIATVWFAVTRPNTLTCVVSQSRDQAREFYYRVLNLFKKHPILFSLIEKETQGETRLLNGSRIMNRAVGTEGVSIRGLPIDLLIVDEADFIPELVFNAIEATQASTDGSLVLISTPNKKGSTFYKYFQDGWDARRKYDEGLLDRPVNEITEEGDGMGFMSFHYDYKVGLEALRANGKPQLSKRVILRAKRNKPKYLFEQEYLAVWSEDISAYFNSQYIKDAFSAFEEGGFVLLEEGEPNKQYYMGVDFAKQKDRTVAVIVEKVSEAEVRVVHRYVVEGRDWDRQLEDIRELARRFPIIKAYFDETGLGQVLVDLENNNYLSPLHGKIEGVVFSTKSKTAMYGNLTRLFGNRLIAIPNDKMFIDELIDLQYEKTDASEYVRIKAPTGGFDDHPDALALACMFTIKVSIDDIAKAIVRVSRMHRKEEDRRDLRTKDDFTFEHQDYIKAVSSFGTKRKSRNYITRNRNMRLRKYI